MMMDPIPTPGQMAVANAMAGTAYDPFHNGGQTDFAPETSFQTEALANPQYRDTIGQPFNPHPFILPEPVQPLEFKLNPIIPVAPVVPFPSFRRDPYPEMKPWTPPIAPAIKPLEFKLNPIIPVDPVVPFPSFRRDPILACTEPRPIRFETEPVRSLDFQLHDPVLPILSRPDPVFIEKPYKVVCDIWPPGLPKPY